MACGVKIRSFSAALLHHMVCSITIYCRDREGQIEREGERGAVKGNSGSRGGGGGEALGDAGDEEVDVKELERRERVRK